MDNLSKEDANKLRTAHAGATAVIIKQLRQNPAFTEPIIQHFIGLMNRHNHLMLVILNGEVDAPGPEEDTAVSEEAGA